MKIVEYKTAAGTDPAKLDQEVMSLLSQGYQLYGSPYSILDKIMAQAMVRGGMVEKSSSVEIKPETLVEP